MNPAMWAVIGYRFNRWISLTFPRPLRWLLTPLTIPLHIFLEVATNVQISIAASVGGGLHLPHSGTIVIGSRSALGENCTVCHSVTIGHAGGGRRGVAGSPVIGDRVYIGPGAIIVGPIHIGDDCLIGAGAVVVKSLPDRAVAAGNPARILSYSGAFALIEYPEMQNDLKRLESIQNASAMATDEHSNATTCEA